MKTKTRTTHKKTSKTIQKSHVATVAQNQLKETIKVTKESVGKMHEHLRLSDDLISVGIHTEISKYIESVISKPLDALSDYTNSIVSSWNLIVIKFAETFFNKNKNIVSSVYYEDRNNTLCFYVILKNEDTKNRSKIYDFFDTEIVEKASQHISIYIKFVSELTEANLLSQNNNAYSQLIIK
jgi:hypothetical protein